MQIKNATLKYEAWLAKQITIIEADLKLKHQHMAEDPFPFLRATFYRWAQVWPKVCPELAKASSLLAVGDLHVENFGVNDLDESYPMAYTNDLVRLAVSAHLAIAGNHLAVNVEDACRSILEGYKAGLDAGGRPFVLEEGHNWLREVATGDLRDPVHFWGKMSALVTVRRPIPKGARKALERLLPERGLPYRVAHRVAGLGSLGRERYVALAEWRGGQVAREAKALLPSSCVWANKGKGSRKIFYQELIDTCARVPDPFVHLCGRWIVRRLAPHCSRIELASLPKKRDEEKLLHAMGFETANMHCSDKKSLRAVRKDFTKRKGDWLHQAAKKMREAVMEDWTDWRKGS